MTAPERDAQAVLPVNINSPLISGLQERSGVQVSGSLHAVSRQQQQAAAHLLTQAGAWVHADVFADPGIGVSLDLINRIAEDGRNRIDVHLLTADAVAVLDNVCHRGITRITFPFESVSEPELIAEQIRSAGVSPWLAVAPGTTLTASRHLWPHIDGLLVMLLPPGTSGNSDPAMLTKVNQASAALPVGVDGGVGEHNVGDVLAAGATYIVIGRRLLLLDSEQNAVR